jgi:dihydroceramide fatty acyl 2-hydroxylase
MTEHTMQTQEIQRIRPMHSTTARMFKNPVIEYFSRIHPVTPFVVWGPVAGWFAFRSVQRSGVALPTALMIIALFVWTLLEYVLHRYIFHWEGKSKLAKRIHFLIHGVHHQFPHDQDRLVMPIGASAPLGVALYAILYLATGGARFADPLFVGLVLGYLAYDATHFAVHRFSFQNRIFRRLKRHHMIHHHIDREGGFGVSSPLWDHVFRSVPKRNRRHLGKTLPRGNAE